VSVAVAGIALPKVVFLADAFFGLRVGLTRTSSAFMSSADASAAAPLVVSLADAAGFGVATSADPTSADSPSAEPISAAVPSADSTAALPATGFSTTGELSCSTTAETSCLLIVVS